MAEKPAYTVQIVRDVLAREMGVSVAREVDGRTEYLTPDRQWVLDEGADPEYPPIAASFRDPVWAAIVSEIKGN